MDRLRGREIDGNRITVVIAKDRRKTPDEMKVRDERDDKRSGSKDRDNDDRDADRDRRDRRGDDREDENRNDDSRDDERGDDHRSSNEA